MTEILCNTITKNGLKCKCKIKKGFNVCGKHLTKNCKAKLININNKITSIFSVKDIRHTLSYYNINYNEKLKKNEVLKILKDWVIIQRPYLKNINKILIIQKLFRLYLVKYTKSLTKNHNNIDDIVNSTEFYSLDNISNIPTLYKVYYNENNKIFVFDIRYLINIINTNKKNPYSQLKFNNLFILKCQKIYQLLKLRNFIPIKQPIHLTTKQKIVKLFLDMDSLDQYTNPTWFFELSKIQLRNFYIEVEDIWNYRLQLTDEFRKEIYPAANLFIYKSFHLNKIHQKVKLQEICLDIIDKLINSSKKRANRINGCIYILMGLTIVNKKAAKALPQIASSVDINIL